jgi:hypothetical protein
MTKIKNLLETSPLNVMVNVGFDQYNELDDIWEIILSKTYTISELLDENNDEIHPEIKELLNEDIEMYLSRNKMNTLIIAFNKDIDYRGGMVRGIQIIKQL